MIVFIIIGIIALLLLIGLFQKRKEQESLRYSNQLQGGFRTLYPILIELLENDLKMDLVSDTGDNFIYRKNIAHNGDLLSFRVGRRIDYTRSNLLYTEVINNEGDKKNGLPIGLDGDQTKEKYREYIKKSYETIIANNRILSKESFFDYFLAEKNYQKTVLDKLNETHINTGPNQLIKSIDLKRIMSQRTVIPFKAVGNSCLAKIDKIQNETAFLNKDKQQIYSTFAPFNEIKKKIVYCNSNSQIEMEKEENKDLLRQGILFEKKNNYEKADMFFKTYLEKVQFKFSLLSNNKIYTSIKPGDNIKGLIKTYSNKDGVDFLTFDSSTVNFEKLL